MADWADVEELLWTASELAKAGDRMLAAQRYCQAGTMAHHLGELDTAAFAYRAALEIGAHMPRIYEALAAVQLAAGQRAEAVQSLYGAFIRYLRKAKLEAAMRTAEALVDRAVDAPLVIEMANALEQSSHRDEATRLVTRASDRFLAEEHYEAFAELTRWLLQHGADPVPLRAKVGQAQLKCGRFSDALTVFETVLRQDPDNIHALEGAIDAFFGLGQTDRAIACAIDAFKRLASGDANAFAKAERLVTRAYVRAPQHAELNRMCHQLRARRTAAYVSVRSANSRPISVAPTG